MSKFISKLPFTYVIILVLVGAHINSWITYFNRKPAIEIKPPKYPRMGEDKEILS